MPAKFEIARVISRGTRKGHEEVVINFNGESITRHLINGVGRHPDARVPGWHDKLTDAIATAKREVAGRDVSIAALEEKKPKGYIDQITNHQRNRDLIKAQIPSLEEALRVLQKEDPIMVYYS